MSSVGYYEIITFGTMQLANKSGVLVETITIASVMLERVLNVDVYIPRMITDPSQLSLLLINDGQDLSKMDFADMLEKLYADEAIHPVFCVGIHCGPERKMEYGVAGVPDYLGRGARAGAYTSFIMEELIPFIRETYAIHTFREKACCGFSLGGLMALDMVLQLPGEFTKAGVFSGSFWWRSMDQEDSRYDDKQHRIIHEQIKKCSYHEWQQFFFQCGNKDETKDRNNNGIIDSIDDTLDVIKELECIGYPKEAITFLQMEDGRHDVATWGLAMPVFLKWGWGAKMEK